MLGRVFRQIFLQIFFIGKSRRRTACALRALLGGLLLGSCSIPIPNLSITLDETPLYPPKQWAVVKMPYVKLNLHPTAAPNNDLLGMLRFGNIVEIQSIEIKDKATWALILRPEKVEQAQSKFMQGWVPYNFLHVAGNFKEAQLSSRQMQRLESP